MVKEERLQAILEQLTRDNKVQLSEMSRLLNVSEDTIRRDIKELDIQGLLKAVRGGAIANSTVPHHYRDRENYDLGQKKVIADKAVQFLKDGQVVFFDGGTSVLALAQSLPKDLKITVVTNSFPVANALEDHPNAEVIFAGGRLYKTAFTTIGMQTIETIRNIRANVYFFGVSSIHTIGLTAKSYEDSEVKKNMVEMSSQIIALSTLEKVNTAETYYICPVTDIDVIITEADPDSPELKAYKDMGIRVV
ncbi:DeoR/GlpR family DNA-binding transcription regulator [Flavobacterium subsaxonicum]|uniref:DeoR faimly transcriptional regulator n=1 Tax=Flavobacterium subsaxonicum WB 4.1-42 = DSM 21790 TaxID=1121898 RepID=A0A0A2MI82_9FLAO|nr:DeoR/GlpR family DNA-binding transcription regulator [Flavobacterium subsaxonicum]KGO91281.1 DeoR faimly transcriptional regulator [Flavobacterium subsaxonicum WB 4.1-42 = DSM 21790]